MKTISAYIPFYFGGSFSFLVGGAVVHKEFERKKYCDILLSFDSSKTKRPTTVPNGNNKNKKKKYFEFS